MPEPQDTPEVTVEDAQPTVIDQPPQDAGASRPKKRWGLRLGLFALFAIALIGGGAWLAPLIEKQVPGLLPKAASPSPDPRIAETASQLGRLAARIDALEARPVAEGEDLEIDLAALIARIDALETRPVPQVSDGPSNELVKNLIMRLDGLEAQLRKIDAGVSDQDDESKAALGRLRRDVADLREKLASFETAPRAKGDFVGAAFFVAVGELRRQIDQGNPYRREFARLEALTRQGRAVDPVTASYLSILSKHADTGVATLALLRESYGAAADAAIEAAAPVDGGVWQRAWQSIASVVKIRRVGEVEGDTPDAIISRAHARLDEGDVAGAVEEMAGLRQASEPVATWIEAAVAHLQTRDALDSLEQRGFWGDAPS